MWTGENLFKRFLAEHRGHGALTTSMSSAYVGPSAASCGCGPRAVHVSSKRGGSLKLIPDSSRPVVSASCSLSARSLGRLVAPYPYPSWGSRVHTPAEPRPACVVGPAEPVDEPQANQPLRVGPVCKPPSAVFVGAYRCASASRGPSSALCCSVSVRSRWLSPSWLCAPWSSDEKRPVLATPSRQRPDEPDIGQ